MFDDVDMTDIALHVNLCTKVGLLFRRFNAGRTETGSLKMFDEASSVMANTSQLHCHHQDILRLKLP
jgi:hypothetical protein